MPHPDASTPRRRLLKLCMIVKNEVDDLVRTLASVRPYIDAWTILDTGSTDGTQAQIRALLAEVPGALHERPFVDFATTRNAALALAGTECEYLLCLDAEDVLHEGARLREFLESPVAAGQDAFYLTVNTGGMSFCSPRLSRAGAGWRYRGVVHELLMGPQDQIPQVVVPGVTITQTRSSASAARTRARWERDLQLLLAEVARHPEDTRSVFYLAQTYACLGGDAEAIAWYRRRIELGGWHEEVYAAIMMLARLTANCGHPWPEVQQLYLEAFAIAPHRAEPLCAIAQHYLDERAFPVAFVFAQRAQQLPYPAQDRLFVDAEIYAWRAAALVGITAYHVGAFELGEHATRHALVERPDDPSLRETLGFYEQIKARQL
ncbi:MAG TPA: glycosyltransferase [Oscillatoriaceae cyanobacterium]